MKEKVKKQKRPISAELEQLREELKKSQLFFSRLIEQSPYAIWISDDKGTLIKINRACCDLLNITEEEVIGKYNVLRDNIVKEQGFLPLVKSVFEKGKTVRFEIKYDSSQLKKLLLEKTAFIILDVTIFPLIDTNGRITNAVIQHIDITERKQAEQALLESEERSRSIYENSDDAILLTIPDGTILSANPAACRIFGRTEEEIVRAGRKGVIDTADPRLLGALKERERTGKFSGELTFLRQDGRPFPGEVTSVIFRDRNGQFRTSMIIRDITERKRTEEMVIREAEYWQTTFNSIDEAICILDVEQRIQRCNQAFYHYFNKAKGDIFGRHCWELIHGTKEPVPECPMLRMKKSMHRESMELAINQKWFKVTVDPILNQAGTLAGAVHILHDITEYKQTEMLLKEGRNRYQAIFEATGTATLIVEDDTTIIMANNECRSVTGYNPEELVGTKWPNYVAPESLEIMLKYHKLRREEPAKAPDKYEVRLIHKDGEIHHAMLSIGMIPNSKQSVVSILDITELRRSEEELKESEELLHKIAENYPNSYLSIIEEDLTVGFTSGQEFRKQNLNPDDFFGRTLEQVFGDQTAVVREYYVNTFAGREQSFELFINGQYQFYRTVPLYAQDGTIPRILSVVENITDRKRLEEERQRVAKLESIGILAGGIAHDFNNILTGILGNISLAKTEAQAESELRSRLEDAEKASLRAKDLTQQLLTFSKGGAPIKKLASLGELVKDTASFTLRGSSIKCQFSIPDDLWYAEIDEGQISQVINNLVINAQQAMPSGGTIEVRAENITLTEQQSLGKTLPLGKGNYIRIAVIDKGIGIPEAHLDKIFDPFFTTKQQGSGLGLATSFSIVCNHGGHISMESELGVGSTFYIYLPASKKTATARKSKVKETIPMVKARILVMDDEEAVRDVASRMLKHIGYEDVELVTDGTEAIKRYSEAMKAGKPFGVVILDLTIPGGMGGKETVKKLHELDPRVKAIVSSGYSSESAIIDHKKFGFRGMVAKPYTIEQLRKTLNEVIAGISDTE